MSMTFKRDPLGEMPSMLDWHSQQVVTAYNRKIEDAVKRRCEDYGYAYSPDRLVCIKDGSRNDLYYYKTDSGSLEPLIAISAMEISWTDRDNKITVRMESKELHPDIFKPVVNG